MPSGPPGQERGVLGSWRGLPGWPEGIAERVERDPRILVGETRESRGERRIRIERDDDLDTTDARRPTRLPGGHCGVIRKEGVASLSLKGLVKNAETLQLLPNRSHCLPLPRHPPSLPSHQGPNSCNQADVPRHYVHPYRFSPPGTLYAPRGTDHKGREDLRLLHLQVRGRILIHPSR